jgi:Zn-dependent protease
MRKIRLGSALGIPIDLHVSLLVVVPFLAWRLASPAYIETWAAILDGFAGPEIDPAPLLAGTTPWVIGVVGAVGLFAGVLLHELGHSWVALRYGLGIGSITLWLFGGVAHLEDLPAEWDREFWIALAGPATSVALGVASFLPLYVLPEGYPVLAFLLGWFGFTNVALAVFNMLPAFPMDGGRVLRALLARSRPFVDATRTAVSVAKVMATLLALGGILTLNVMLLLVAGFVFLASTSEATSVVTRELLREVPMRDLMRPRSPSVPLGTPVNAVVDRVLRDRQAEFLVVDESGDVRGLLTLENLGDVSALDTGTVTVDEVMVADPPRVPTSASAATLLKTLGEGPDAVLVEDGGEVVGLISRRDVWQTLQRLQGTYRDAETSRGPVPLG